MASRLALYDITNAKIAHQVDDIEEANWKLTIENNRGCCPVVPTIPSIEIDWPPARLFARRSNGFSSSIYRICGFRFLKAARRTVAGQFWNGLQRASRQITLANAPHPLLIAVGAVVSVRSRVSVHFQTFSTSLLWLPRCR